MRSLELSFFFIFSYFIYVCFIRIKYVYFLVREPLCDCFKALAT